MENIIYRYHVMNIKYICIIYTIIVFSKLSFTFYYLMHKF